MGKNSSFFSALKKAISCASNQNHNKDNRRRRGCFGRQQCVNLDREKAIILHASSCSPQPMEDVKLFEAESKQNRHAYSVALVTAVAAEAAVAAANAAAEIVRLRAAVHDNISCKTKEETSAVKIQAAFRGYKARRVLRGLMRLKSVVGGKSIECQATASLKCMQTMGRLQSEIRMRRISLLDYKYPSIDTQIVEMLNRDIVISEDSKGENWDVSMRSKEQIEADLSCRKEAAMRRERALAYAYSHQRVKNPSNSTNETFVELNDFGWGRGWLERWMVAQPWEKADAVDNEANNNLVADEKAASGRGISIHGSLSRQSPSTPKLRAGGRIRPPSPRGGIGTDDDSKSLNSTQSEQCRRRSYAGSSARDDNSLVSSPAIPGYMAHTESARARARARSRLPSPSLQGSETSGSAKKRLSFSGSPGRPRRHSTPTRSFASP